jgi:hypothetical protein
MDEIQRRDQAAEAELAGRLISAFHLAEKRPIF